VQARQSAHRNTTRRLDSWTVLTRRPIVPARGSGGRGSAVSAWSPIGGPDCTQHKQGGLEHVYSRSSPLLRRREADKGSPQDPCSACLYLGRLTCGAEGAGHLAADLAGDAQCGTGAPRPRPPSIAASGSIVPHDDRLHLQPILQQNQEGFINSVQHSRCTRANIYI
jgi:hypothetical protein